MAAAAAAAAGAGAGAGAGAAGAAADVSPVLVREPLGLLQCLRRLHETTDSLVFWNADKTIRLMLRVDAEDSDQDTMAFCLGVVVSEDDDDAMDLTEVLKLEHEGYLDEDVFVIETVTLSRSTATPGDEDLIKVMRAINRLFAFRICPCAQYFLKDEDHAVCAWCLLGSAGADMETEFCCICHQKAAVRHMAKQPCCGQKLHQLCLDAWNRSRGGEAPCPMCRAEPSLAFVAA